jgi:hypothetical protein
VGEDETHPGFARQAELGDDRLEVVAVGAEAVEPDDGGPRRPVGVDLDGGRRSRSYLKAVFQDPFQPAMKSAFALEKRAA